MSDANFLQILAKEETTWGTQATGNFQTMRATGESLVYNIENVVSEEIRSDRQTLDLVQVGASAGGDIPDELSYGSYDDWLSTALMAASWTQIASQESVTNVDGVNDEYDMADTTGFAVGHLVRGTGFDDAGNNVVSKVTTVNTNTSIAVDGDLTADASPAAGHKVEVVGFQGTSGDVTASANGLTSTTLDFTTLGLAAGMWIKVGGTATADKFATSDNNAWIRITAIAANALTCDNLPSGWATDTGTGKTIKVWVGDYCRNGTTSRSWSIEKAYTSQTTAAYLMHIGMMIDRLSLNIAAQSIFTGAFGWIGKSAGTSTSSGGGIPVVATTTEVMNAAGNVARIAQGGSVVSSPNYVRSLSLELSNNLRAQMAVGSLGAVGIGVGAIDLTGTMETYFGDKTLYDDFIAGSSTSVNFVVDKNSQAYVVDLPKIKFESGNPAAPGRNQDVFLNLAYRAVLDDTLNSANPYTIHLQRCPYFEE